MKPSYKQSIDSIKEKILAHHNYPVSKAALLATEIGTDLFIQTHKGRFQVSLKEVKDKAEDKIFIFDIIDHVSMTHAGEKVYIKHYKNKIISQKLSRYYRDWMTYRLIESQLNY